MNHPVCQHSKSYLLNYIIEIAVGLEDQNEIQYNTSDEISVTF